MSTGQLTYRQHVAETGYEGSGQRLVRRRRSATGGPGWMIGGLVVLGVGLLAAYKFGPDLVRYIKMERM